MGDATKWWRKTALYLRLLCPALSIGWNLLKLNVV